MIHKLQPSPLTNNGLDSVVPDNPQTSRSEIPNNDAGSRCDRTAAESTLEIVSTGNSQQSHTSTTHLVSESSTKSASRAPEDSRDFEPASGLPEPRELSEVRESRCEVARSAGYDPTGERAVACGALAQVVCEYCGPMCASCAEETFCFYGEHRFVDPHGVDATTTNSGALSEEPKPLFEVVYLELKCPDCDTLRLALPAAHLPSADATLGCPICSTPTTWTYLAHGVTQRDLPFYEPFDPDALKRGRIPWDQLAALLDEDDE